MIEIWYQDESRLGLIGSVYRTWWKRGERAEVIKQHIRKWRWIFGAANPVSGEKLGLIFEKCNKDSMRLFLQAFTKMLGEDRHAILILDNASWHGKCWESEFPNVTLLHLPPYSPQLNPAERLWEDIKINGIGNRVFESLDDLLNLFEDVWDGLGPERIQSLCRLPEYLRN